MSKICLSIKSKQCGSFQSPWPCARKRPPVLLPTGDAAGKAKSLCFLLALSLRPNAFVIITANRVLHCNADTPEEMHHWITLLQRSKGDTRVEGQEFIVRGDCHHGFALSACSVSLRVDTAAFPTRAAALRNFDSWGCFKKNHVRNGHGWMAFSSKYIEVGPSVSIPQLITWCLGVSLRSFSLTF